MSNIGMMEGAYFVGRVELLNWLNDLLKLDYTKVEQTCTGAAFCQIMDAIFPGKVQLSKVNFTAKLEYEWIANFKVLQTVFDKQQIDKFIDVAKLTKGKYQDNLEFLQWIKRYFDLNYSGGEYNAVERRSIAATKGTGGSSVPKKTVGAPVKKTPVSTEAPKKSVAIAPKPTTKTATSSTSSAPKPKPTSTPKTPSTDSAVDDSKITELNLTIAELRVTIDGLEKERDFYFSKLRDVEVMCQTATAEETPDYEELMKKIFKVLYATDESEEYVQTETGEEVPQETAAEEETF